MKAPLLKVFFLGFSILCSLYARGQQQSVQEAKHGVCTMSSNNISQMVKLFFDREHPKNVILEMTGHAENSANWKMAGRAYDLYSKGLSTKDVKKELYDFCQTFSLETLFDDSNNSELEEAPICIDLSASVWQILNDNETGSLPNSVLAQMLTGNEHPNPKELVAIMEFGRKLKNKDLAQKEFMDQLFQHCNEQSEAIKLALVDQFYEK